jgi:hypothetical protein
MSKEAEAPRTFDNSSPAPRSNERVLLADAIAARDVVDREQAAVERARSRARDDVRRARRAHEDALEALTETRREYQLAMADSYIAEDAAPRHDALAEAEAALGRAKARLDDLQSVADSLEAHVAPPGRSVPRLSVDAAVRQVIRSSPIVRRLAADYRVAEQTFQQYHSTLRWLAGRGMIPADLTASCPSANATFFADPDPAWIAAIQALSADAGAPLPT